MDRRTFMGTLTAAGAALPLLNRIAVAQTSLKTKNVVFVHGLFADGSSWSKVIARLQRKGVNCTSVQNPLTSLDEASEAARRAIAFQPGPTVLVGHSYSGMIVTEAGVDPKVTALVYVAARAPDAGEDYTALAMKYPTAPASAGVVFNDDWGHLSEEAFLHDFAGDLPRDVSPWRFRPLARRSRQSRESAPPGAACTRCSRRFSIMTRCNVVTAPRGKSCLRSLAWLKATQQQTMMCGSI